MGRSSGGSYTLPGANFVNGTTADAAAVNAKFSDLATEMTDSLSRSGNGGMLARLRGVNGTQAAPAYSFTSETSVGFYRAGSADVRFASAGTDVMKWSTTAVTVYKATTFSEAVTVSSGGLVVTAGGFTVTAGGLTVTAGGMTVSAGGLNATGTLPAAGGMTGATNLTAAGTTSTTSGETFALHSFKGTVPGPQAVALTVRVRNPTTVTNADQAELGISYDAVTTPSYNGAIYLGRSGARIIAGVAATATDPANALTLENGNLKLSGTAPNANEALTNTLTPANIPKAWANVTTVGGTSTGATVNAGFNVSAAAVSGATLTITLASGVGANSAVVVTPDNGSVMYAIGSAAGTTVSCRAVDFGSGTIYDLQAGTARTFSILVFGIQ
jgi:hypothetical protein